MSSGAPVGLQDHKHVQPRLRQSAWTPSQEDETAMRMIFVNLPVKDLEASKGFFGELGFEFNPEFTDESAACMVVDENIFVMLLVEERFRDFINGEIADATKATEVLTCLSANSKEQVDEPVEKAIAADGKPWKPTM
jgi:predicted lactoylglutathione lyase